ncbi:uncharacterized protein LOC130613185 isoform X2 [Hydractinia symbiolongicarpus]|nr:uncharacterized protein LOC130613185 isoform X2 [Hydractinia symbiolongicarpus]
MVFNKTFICFRCSRNVTEFVFGQEQGLDFHTDYSVLVTPMPTKPGEFNSTFIGRCPPLPLHSMAPSTLPSLPPSTSSTTKTSTITIWQIIFILAGVCLSTVVLVTMAMCYRRRNAPYKDMSFKSNKTQTGISVYISHCASDNKEEEKILQLASLISSYGVSVCIDLCSHVEINQMGGLPHWVPDKMANVKKILLILSPCYIQAVTSHDLVQEAHPENVCRVRSEFNYIKTFLYHACQTVPDVVILLDNVNKNDVPTVCKGRGCCSFPSSINENDSDCKRLIGLLLEIEPIQIVTTPT